MTLIQPEKELLYKNLLEKYADYVTANDILEEMQQPLPDPVLSQKKQQAIMEWQIAYNSLHQNLDYSPTA